MGRRGVGCRLALGLLVGLAACTAAPEAPEPPERSTEWPDAPWEEARRRGATFRAVGNEPGWYVEVFADSLVLAASYGEEVYRFTEVTTSPAGAEPFVYRAASEGHALTVTHSAAPCRDAMSGQPFETTATVTLDGQTFRGCGRVLE